MMNEQTVAQFWAERFGLPKEYKRIRDVLRDIMEPFIDPRETRYLAHMDTKQRELFRALTRVPVDPVTQSPLFLPAMTLAGYPASKLGLLLLASQIRQRKNLDSLVSLAKIYYRNLKNLLLAEYQAQTQDSKTDTTNSDDLAALSSQGGKQDEQ